MKYLILAIRNFQEKCKNSFANCQNILQIANCKPLIRTLSNMPNSIIHHVVLQVSLPTPIYVPSLLASHTNIHKILPTTNSIIIKNRISKSLKFSYCTLRYQLPSKTPCPLFFSKPLLYLQIVQAPFLMQLPLHIGFS